MRKVALCNQYTDRSDDLGIGMFVPLITLSFRTQ